MRNRLTQAILKFRIGDEQREDQLQGHGDKGVLEGDDQRLGDLFGVECGNVVGQTNKAGTVLEEVHIGKAVIQRLTEGERLKDEKADDPRDQIKQALIFIDPFLKRSSCACGRITFFHPKSSFCRILKQTVQQVTDRQRFIQGLITIHR